jgi:hypothetical protein
MEENAENTVFQQEPAAEPAAEPVAEPAAEPVAEPAAEPAAEYVPEPVPEPVAAPELIQPNSTTLSDNTIVENIKEYDGYLGHVILSIQGSMEAGYTLSIQTPDGSVIEKTAQWNTKIAELFNKTIEVTTNAPNFFRAVLNKKNHFYCAECNQTDNGLFVIAHSEECVNRNKITIF